MQLLTNQAAMIQRVQTQTGQKEAQYVSPLYAIRSLSK